MSTAINEMHIAKLAEAARRMKLDGGANVATIALRVHINDEDETRVTYSAHIGEYGLGGLTEVADSLEELVTEIGPQLVNLRARRDQEIEDLKRRARTYGLEVVPVTVAPPINWTGGMVSTATSPGVAVLEGGE